MKTMTRKKRLKMRRLAIKRVQRWAQAQRWATFTPTPTLKDFMELRLSTRRLPVPPVAKVMLYKPRSVGMSIIQGPAVVKFGDQVCQTVGDVTIELNLPPVANAEDASELNAEIASVLPMESHMERAALRRIAQDEI